MVEKVHGVLAALSIIAIVSSMFSIVPSLASTVNILQSNTGSLGNSLSLTNSALIKGTFIENVYAQYTDGTTAIIGTNWNYPVSPVIQFAFVQNPANQKTISNFIVTLSFSASSIPSFISSTTVSGNIQVNAAVSGSDGQEHVLVANQNISVPSTSISNGLTRTFYTFLISPSQIAQYNALSGTHQATLKIYSYPSLTFISTISAATGGTSTPTTQQSTWSSWVTQFVTLNIGNSSPTTTTTTQTQTQNSGPIVTQPTPVTQAGVTLTSGTLKFFYTLQFQGDPSIYCGVAQPAPNGGCIVNPTSGPLSVALKSLNIVGSNKGTINSLQVLNVEAELIPQKSGLNLGTSKIVYTGALSIQGQTIQVPSSAITSDGSSFVDSTGVFRFPTASINPVTIDQLLKSNNIQPTSATDMTIRIFATGTFTGTVSGGVPFQGTLNSPYVDIPVWYVANLPTAPTTATGPAYNPNCNFGVNPDGTCQSYPTTSTCQNGLSGANCQGPPTTNTTNNTVPTCSNGDVLTLVGTQYYCIVQPNNPPDTPPNTPPSTCQTAGSCQDPPPNPPTPPTPTHPPDTPPCPSLDCGTTLPDPNNPPSTGSTNPPVICSGLTCATNFTTNNLPPVNPSSLSLDPTTTIGLVLTVGSIIAIIIVIAIHKKND